ncbi:MAG: PleD family two-component system response regulator [Planctomycetota bacterium]|jgi:CheY-like chemotaxis protein
MSRILLIHWNAGEAEERAGRLRGAGHEVRCHADQGGAGLRGIGQDPPDAFVIDLGRLPSHGRAVATWLRQQKATRHVPIVFVEGDPQKTRRVRELLPDAVYTGWSRIRGSLGRALRRPPADPVVPDTMAGYAGTPLPRKLGIAAGSVVALVGAPKGFERTLGALPPDVAVHRQARGRPGLILLFARSRAELSRRFPAAARALAEGGRLWIAWPKKASGVASDLSQTAVRAFGLGAGFVDYKISALDATWSALCFARRRARGSPGR